MHVHTDHKSLRYLKTCHRPLTPRQARWSQFLEEYNFTLWYVPGIENLAADACSRLTSGQLMDIQNTTRTRAFMVPLVENWVSPEGEPVDEFLNVPEDSFSHDEVWPQAYDHLYVTLRSRRSVERALMFTSTQNQPNNPILNQPSSRRTVSHCRRTRR